jgi:purine-nucleoside phosphorylase
LSADYFAIAEEAAEWIAARIDGRKPRLGIVLGSAFGAFADRPADAVKLDYGEVPHFRKPTVDGHAGTLVVGTIEGLEVAVLGGRTHCYEGYSAAQVAIPVRTLARLGVEAVVLTNAAGGVNTSFEVGDLMVIDDHINLLGDNPLRGTNEARFGPRFPDLTFTYDAEFCATFDRVAASAAIPLRHGVYASVLGPSYETPAEVRMLAALGVDAVGMSTVPEAIAARHCGLRVAGVSCITNAAAGLSGAPLVHEDVMEQASNAAGAFAVLLEGLCREHAHGARTDNPG